MKRNDLLKTICLMVIIIGLTVGSSILLNLHTGQIIEANSAGAVLEQLKVVMPDAAGFDDLYNDADPSKSKLTVQPTPFVYEGDKVDGTSGKVLSIYKEKSEPSKGYVFRVSITTQFSKSPIEYTVAVNADGIITGINQDVYTDSKTVDGLTESFIGQDSALGGVSLVAGVTYSSKGIKVAIEQTMNLLVANGFFAAGEKSDADIALELIGTVFTGFVKGEEVTGTGAITKAFKSTNGAGLAMLSITEEVTYLVISNNMNAVKVFALNEEKTELVDVTSEQTALATEAKTFAATNTNTDLTEALALVKKISKSEDVKLSTATFTSFNSISAVYEVVIEGATYYAFYSTQPGFYGETMHVCAILTSEGKVYKADAKQMIIMEDAFHGFNGVPNNYLSGLQGADSTSDLDSLTAISGATISSDAMKNTLKDAFAAFATLENGGNN